MQVLKVLIEYGADSIDRTFDYLLNSDVNAKGCRVSIDFGTILGTYQFLIQLYTDCLGISLILESDSK